MIRHLQFAPRVEKSKKHLKPRLSRIKKPCARLPVSVGSSPNLHCPSWVFFPLFALSLVCRWYYQLPAITTRPDISQSGPHLFCLRSDSEWIRLGNQPCETESVSETGQQLKEPWQPKPTVKSGITLSLSSRLAMTAG